MHNLNELKLWHKAVDLAKAIYQATSDFPKHEIYGLTSQIPRSAVSIPSNIAEGTGRNTNNDFKHFLAIANGSSYELQTQIIIAEKLKLMNSDITVKLLNELDELQASTESVKFKIIEQSDLETLFSQYPILTSQYLLDYGSN